jgi:dynein heavy chain 2
MTKASSITISDSLTESVRLQASLDQERSAYLPLAENGSKLFFIISDLCKINNMYRFSLAAFLRLFQRALQGKQVTIKAVSQDHLYRIVCVCRRAAALSTE